MPKARPPDSGRPSSRRQKIQGPGDNLERSRTWGQKTVRDQAENVGKSAQQAAENVRKVYASEPLKMPLKVPQKGLSKAQRRSE